MKQTDGSKRVTLGKRPSTWMSVSELLGQWRWARSFDRETALEGITLECGGGSDCSGISGLGVEPPELRSMRKFAVGSQSLNRPPSESPVIGFWLFELPGQDTDTRIYRPNPKLDPPIRAVINRCEKRLTCRAI
jgi:hypothetical protein